MWMAYKQIQKPYNIYNFIMSVAFLCRTCDKQINCHSARNLFIDEDDFILNNLKTITGLWLVDGFNMPKKMCASCLSDLDHAIEFRERCIKMNNFWLRKNFGNKLSRRKSNFEQIETQINNDPLSNEKELDIKLEPAEELSCEASSSDQSHEMVSHRNPTQEQTKSNYEEIVNNCVTDEEAATPDDLSRVAFHGQSRKYLYEQFGMSFNDESNEQTVEEQLVDAYLDSAGTVVDREHSSPIVPASSTESQSSVALYKRLRPAKARKMIKVGSTKKEISRYPRTSTQHSPGKRVRKLGDYFCDQCGRHFNDKANFNRHLQRHLGLKNFECQECGYKDYSQHLINLHTRIQHQGEKPYACKYCGERYANSMTRLRHQRNHIEYLDSVAVIPAFTCKLCGKTFTKKSILDTHAVVHTGEQPFCCDICNVFFNRKSSLRTHYRSKFHQKNATRKLDQTGVNN